MIKTELVGQGNCITQAIQDSKANTIVRNANMALDAVNQRLKHMLTHQLREQRLHEM